MISDKWVVQPHGVEPPTYAVRAEIEAVRSEGMDAQSPATVHHSYVEIAGHLEHSIACMVADDHNRLRETYVDEAGTVWTVPTGWAYAQACRVLNQLKDSIATYTDESGKVWEPLSGWQHCQLARALDPLWGRQGQGKPEALVVEDAEVRNG